MSPSRPPGRLARVLTVTCAAASVLSTAPAVATAAGWPISGGSERQIRRVETANLGAEHAAEHATERRALRAWEAKPAAERERIAARSRRAATRATAAAGPPNEVGRWSPTRIDLPTWAINSAMLPTGKVAFWGRGALGSNGLRVNSAPFYLWDPATGKSTRIDPPTERIDYDGDGVEDDMAPAPIFCSGQSFLPDGELYVAGGNLFYPGYGSGHANYGGFSGTYTFDPWTETWTTQPRMAHGRWYPTQTELPDGRTIVASGYDENGNAGDNSQLDVFTPAAERGGRGTLKEAPAGQHATRGFYPQLQVLPGGKVVEVSNLSEETRLLDPAKLDDASVESAWTTLAGVEPNAAERVGGSAALLPGTSTMIFLGGYGESFPMADPNFQPAARSVETADFASSDPHWSEGQPGDAPNLNLGRSYGTLVSLPDGGFAYVGGAAGFDGSTNGAGNNAEAKTPSAPVDGRLKSVELWRPGQAAWTLGPTQAKFRGYHSTATLLPDGRILSAGDDYWGFDDARHQEARTPQDQGEIYEPAYLFDGSALAARPTIASLPSAVRWNAPFGVGIDEVPGRPIVRATLVAPTAQTHSVDMNRDVVDLHVLDRVAGKGVDLLAPSGPDVARPGWYMLFAWDSHGTPAVARWVQLKADAPDAPLIVAASPPPTSDDPPSVGPDPDAPTGLPTDPSVPAPAPGPVARDVVGPRTALVVPRPRRRATSLTLRLGADEPGTFVVGARTGSGPTRGPERTHHVRLTRAHLRREVRLHLSVADRRTLRGGRTLRLVLRVAGTDLSGNVARRTVTIRLRPRG